jgi:flagellar protein FliL
MTAEAEFEDGTQPEQEGAPQKRKFKLKLNLKLSRRMLIIGGAGLGLVLALGAGAYFLLFAGAKPAAEVTHLEAVPETFIFNLPTMTVNLNGEGDGEQFMKLTVALEVANEEMMVEIQPRMAKVVDAFQVYLRELRKSDLEGSAGIYRLKEELRRRVNVAIFPAQVESILFREILVQ